MTYSSVSTIDVLTAIDSESEQERVLRFRKEVAAFLNRGEFAEALRMAEEGLTYFTGRNERRGEAMAFFHLGNAYRGLRNLAAALDAYHRCEAKYESLGDKAGIGDAYNGLGLTHKHANEYSLALRYFHDGIPLAQEVGDHISEANAIANIAAIHAQIGDHATALEMLHRAIALYESMGDEHKMGIALLNIGINYVMLNDSKTAIPPLERGLALLEKVGDRYHIASLVDVLGAAYINLDQFESGLEHLYRGLRIFEAIEAAPLVAMSVSRIGGTLLKIGRFEEAKTLLERALATNDKSGDRRHHCENLSRLAALYANPDFAGQDDATALQLLQEAKSIAEELDLLNNSRTIYSQMADLYERQGDTTVALAYHRQMYQAEKRIFNEESDKRIRNLQVQFDVSQTQQSAEIARRDAEIAHLRTVELAEVLRETERLRVLADKRANYNHRIAETLQQTVLPTLPEQIAPDLSVRTFYQPASDEAAVGGDFYDVFPLTDGKTVLVVGDVIGHGLEAAISISEVRYALRAFLSLNSAFEPGDALGQLNNFLVKTNEMRRVREGRGFRNRMVALTMAVIEPAMQEVCLVSAGMEPAVLVRAETGKVEYLDAGDMVLGAIPGVHYEARRTRIAPGDLLAVTTDGITEAFGAGGKLQFGGDGLGRNLSALLRSDSPDPMDLRSIGDTIISQVREFVGSAFRDDVCLLLAQISPADADRQRL